MWSKHNYLEIIILETKNYRVSFFSNMLLFYLKIRTNKVSRSCHGKFIQDIWKKWHRDQINLEKFKKVKSIAMLDLNSCSIIYYILK